MSLKYNVGCEWLLFGQLLLHSKTEFICYFNSFPDNQAFFIPIPVDHGTHILFTFPPPFFFEFNDILSDAGHRLTASLSRSPGTYPQICKKRPADYHPY